MNVLLVSNQHYNEAGVGNPIMYRMKYALEQDNRIDIVDFEPAYNSIKSLLRIRNKAKSFDIVHIHFGGIYAMTIWFFLLGVRTKKIITFHGTDIHAKALKTEKRYLGRVKICLNQKASFISIILFDRCGFVAKNMMDYVPFILHKQLLKKSFVQKLGVDYNVFIPASKEDAQRYLGLPQAKYVLFSDVSNTNIKRRDVAESIIREFGGEYRLLIMSGVKQEQVSYYINACDFALLTSDEEGSPNIIREVLALNKPFFSVDVGDAAQQLEGLRNSAIISRDPKVAVETIKACLSTPYVDMTRDTRSSSINFLEVNKTIIHECYCD